jgi:hypothetical protein
MESIRHRFSGAQSSLRADAHAARQRWRPNGPPPQSPVAPGEPAGTPGAPAPDSEVATPGAGTAATAVGHDLPVQLQQLAALHTSGALTDEEYAAAKKRLISGIGG